MLKLIERSPGAKDWERPDDISPILHKLLIKRGIASEAEARAYLRPRASNLYDARLLNGAREAAERLKAAIKRGEKVCVYGDYDADGVCACAILVPFLKELGANAEPYLPSRHQEGYGLNEAAVTELSKRYELLLTVDCGITAGRLTALASGLGMDVIVTDHHRPEGELPDCIVINPLLGDYPFKYLCGAGVAFKLAAALGGIERAMDYIDLAAIATIADIVPLLGENRVIATLGLQKLNSSPRPGVRALINAAQLGAKPLSAGNVAFQIAPRLNAGGRLGDAMRAYTLLTHTNADECARLADELNEENARRKRLENETLSKAERALEAFDFTAHRAIVVCGEGWNPGVIGLAASRLTEKYHYPTIVLTRTGDTLTGSCRSIEGVDIHDALTHASEHIEKFGGHRLAAGLTLRADKLEPFTRALDEYLKANIPDEAYVPVCEYDAEVTPGDLDPMTVNALNALSPTGCQNPEPVFRMRAEAAFARAVGADKAHLKLTLKAPGGALDAIWFRQGARATRARGQVDALFTPAVNAYQGRVTVQAQIKALSPTRPLMRIEAASADIERAFPLFLTQALYNQRYPDAAPQAISLSDFRELALKHLQGLLVVCAGRASAGAALRALGDIDADVEIGEYPTDARRFRAVCICPAGERPQGYARVVSAGVPGELAGADYALDFVPVDAVFEKIPDTGQLRCVYTAARELSRRPHRFLTREALADELSRAAALESVTGAAALMVLTDMELIEIASNGDSGVLVRAPKTRKRDPEENALYQSMRAWQALAREGRRGE